MKLGYFLWYHHGVICLFEANYRLLRAYTPNLAVLPWGAAEAHNYHLPYTTDVIEATELAQRAADLADARGARVIVLSAIPFGNDEMQLDQVAIVSITTSTAGAILDDVVRSLDRQGIDRLVVLNGHGGNAFKPLVQDVRSRYGTLVVLVNFYEMFPDVVAEVFAEAGDHAGELETSMLLHLVPDPVELEHAGPGERKPLVIDSLNQAGMWTPRPWAAVHPDTGSGDSRQATCRMCSRGADPDFFGVRWGILAQLQPEGSELSRSEFS